MQEETLYDILKPYIDPPIKETMTKEELRHRLYTLMEEAFERGLSYEERIHQLLACVECELNNENKEEKGNIK